MLDLYELKDKLEILLIEVWENLEKGFESNDKDIRFKTNENDVVTKYDIEANSKIINYLELHYPNFSIITEESSEINKNSEYSFIVDPIDWTRNFTRWIPFFCTGIWLAKGNDIIFSITYNPITKDLFWAIKWEGAYCNKQKININSTNLKNSNLFFSDFAKDKNIDHFIEKINSISTNTCIHGELANIASGKFEWLISRWAYNRDYCHYLLVEEAWWKVTDRNGDKFDISKNNIVASNWIIHEYLLDALKNNF